MADCFRPGGNNPLAREVNDRSELAGQELNRRASGPGFAGLTDREDDNQGRAFARLAAGRNAAAVTLNELPADGQSNARAFIFAPAMQALKDGKDPVRSFLVKANPVVFDQDSADRLFRHAAQHLSQAADAIFGSAPGEEKSAWFERWKRALRDEQDGVAGVIRSLMSYRNGKELRGKVCSTVPG
jgi:hypothetical protein